MTREAYIKLASEAEIKYGLPTGTMSAIIEQESSFNPNARSEVGAFGLTQIMPANYQELGVTAGSMQDPKVQIDAGARHLAKRYKARKGDLAVALTDYHTGQGNVDRGNIGPVGEKYAASVLRKASAYGGQVLSTRELDSIRTRFGATSDIQDIAADAVSAADAQVSQQAGAIQLDAAEIINRLTANEMDVANAEIAVMENKVAQQSEAAKQSAAILSMLGINAMETSGQLGQTAQALVAARDTLTQETAALAKQRENPIFNVLDIISKGQGSAAQQNLIAQAANTVTTLTKAWGELQSKAGAQIQLQTTASNHMAAEEVKLLAEQRLAKARADAYKLGSAKEIQIERSNQSMQIAQERLQLAQAAGNLAAEKEAFRQQYQRDKANNPTSTKSMSQLRVEADAAADEALYFNTAKAMGMTVPELLTSISVTDKQERAYLEQNLIQSGDKLSMPLAKRKQAAGKNTPEESALFKQVFGTTGWANPNNPANRNYNSAEFLANYAARNKAKAWEKEAIDSEGAKDVANRKLRAIINAGDAATFERNPYAANFDSLAKYASLPSAQGNKELQAVVMSPLYRAVQEEVAADKDKTVPDTRVIDKAKDLVLDKKLTLGEAAAQLSAYYRSAAEVNNARYGFGKFGLPEQDSYVVPMAISYRKDYIAETPPKEKDGKVTPTFTPVDLSNELAVRNMLTTRIGTSRTELLKLAIPFTLPGI